MTNTTIAKLFIMTSQGIGKWKKEKRPIINFIEKYLDEQDIEEFLKTEKIKKFEQFNFIQKNIMDKNQKVYLKSFNEKLHFKSLSTSHGIFIEFYFSFLYDLKEISKQRTIYNLEFNNILISSLNNFLIKKYNKNLLNVKKIEEIDTKSLEFENKSHLENIQKHIDCFKKWGSDMLLYLDYILKDNLQLFLDSNNEELIYHAVGFNVIYYVKNKSLDDTLIENIFNDVISNFIENKENNIKVDEIYLYINKILENSKKTN